MDNRGVKRADRDEPKIRSLDSSIFPAIIHKIPTRKFGEWGTRWCRATRRLFLGGGDVYRLVEAELEESFAGDFDLVAAGEDLDAGACCAAHSCADCGTGAASGDGADDCACNGSAADFFGGVFAASSAFQSVVAR